jgi:DNA-directed RNA polymerase subunit F
MKKQLISFLLNEIDKRDSKIFDLRQKVLRENYINIKQIENIINDISSDREWVNDSETASEYKGVVAGLERLNNHIQELKQNIDE